MHDGRGPSVLYGGDVRAGPYRYGTKKWDDYLLGIQAEIRDAATSFGAATQRKASEQVEQMEALREQLSVLDGTLNWGFSLVADRLAESNEFLQRISKRLDVIGETLNSPTITQAREYYRLGQDRMTRGLFTKAREAFEMAEQKNDVDSLLQLQLGKCLLYGRNERESVVNLPDAVRHLELAHLYADSESATLGEMATRCQREIQYHLGIGHFLLSSQARLSGERTAADAALADAVRALSPPKSRGACYLRAKCHALSGNSQDAARDLREVSDGELKYFRLAKLDMDFILVHAAIPKMAEEVLAAPGPKRRLALDAMEGVTAQFAVNSHPPILGVKGESLPQLEEELRALVGPFRDGTIGYHEVLRSATRLRIQALSRLIAQYQARLNEIQMVGSSIARAQTIAERQQGSLFEDALRRGAIAAVAMFAIGLVPSSNTQGDLFSPAFWSHVGSWSLVSAGVGTAFLMLWMALVGNHRVKKHRSITHRFTGVESQRVELEHAIESTRSALTQPAHALGEETTSPPSSVA